MRSSPGRETDALHRHVMECDFHRVTMKIEGGTCQELSVSSLKINSYPPREEASSTLISSDPRTRDTYGLQCGVVLRNTRVRYRDTMPGEVGVGVHV